MCYDDIQITRDLQVIGKSEVSILNVSWLIEGYMGSMRGFPSRPEAL